MSIGWPPPGVRQRIIELKDLRDLIARLPEGDDALVHLSRYLVVRSAGLIEAVRDDVADQHCRIVGPTRPHKRVSAGLRNGQGVRPSQLIDFMLTFDRDWASQLLDWFEEDDGERKNKIGALVAARKKIAHGDGQSVSSGQALAWADASMEVANWLVGIFDPAN